MTEGGGGGGHARVRIKGKAGSVFRFFSIAASFMVVWMMISSQLGYYSKEYGPQILLFLNIAFILPSIPVLLVSVSTREHVRPPCLPRLGTEGVLMRVFPVPVLA